MRKDTNILCIFAEYMSMKFTLQYKDPASKARAGELTTDHGVVRTPIFMPWHGRVRSRGLSTATCATKLECGLFYLIANKIVFYLVINKEMFNFGSGGNFFRPCSGNFQNSRNRVRPKTLKLIRYETFQTFFTVLRLLAIS